VTDIFREVDEEVRREQLKKLWERYQPVIITMVVLIVAGVGGWRIWEYNQTRRAELVGTRFEQGMILADAGKHEEAERVFAIVAREGTPAYRDLARVRQATEVALRDPAAGVVAYRQIADDPRVELALREIASLRSASLLIDLGGYDDARRILEPMTGAGKDFRHTARELMALAAWKAGDAAATQKWYLAIISDPDSPPASRQRVEMLVALGASGGKS
jgi:hypothetical protein